MADVVVNTGEVTLRTCKLTKSIIKQMPLIAYRDLAGFLRAEDLSQHVVGWISGAGIGSYESETWLIIKTGEGQYARFNAHFEHRKRFQQIYIV